MLFPINAGGVFEVLGSRRSVFCADLHREPMEEVDGNLGRDTLGETHRGLL